MIIYHGPSLLDGSPIAVIATGYKRKTSNAKTGDMIQTWIIRTDLSPLEASRRSLDAANCGNCPQRWSLDGGCYVNLAHAPSAIYRAFNAGRYPSIDLQKLRGRKIRFGAYGDPAAAPFALWQALADISSGHTGYTHQVNHPNFDIRLAGLLQISADTPQHAARMHKRGFKTFRVCHDETARFDSETVCLADSKGIACADCLLCDGRQQNIVIAAHGARKAKTRTIDIKVQANA